MDLLVLFDIDGTLLIDDAYAHGRAIIHALRDVYQVELPDDAVEKIRPWGKTDPRIARDVLIAAGLTNEEIDGRLGVWMRAAADAFAHEADASRWQIRPGTRRALTLLREAGLRRTLLTGNLRGIAAVKIERMGIESDLDLEIGAYGDDAEERAQLVPIARRRAGGHGSPWPRERTLVVGDTPTDVNVAAADGVACIAFESVRFPRDQLLGAYAIVTNFPDLVSVVRARRFGGSRLPEPPA